MDQVEYLREKVTSETDLSKLHSIAVELIAGGADRKQVLADLDRIRVELRAAGEDEIEDRVMELMDFFVGWCAPHVRI